MGAQVLVIGTQEVETSDTEEDRSLLYAYTSNPHAPGSRALKALVLAAKGVLASICGEKARVIQLQHHGSIVSLAVVHLQVCMLVVVLPLATEDGQARQLALTLANALLMLAGPSHQWLTPIPSSNSRHGGACELDTEVKVVLDTLCGGLMQQLCLQPGIPTLLAPWLAFPGALAHLQLAPHRQRRLEELLLCHQDAATLAEVSGATQTITPTGAAPRRLSRVTTALAASTTQEGWQPPSIQLYQRTCCMLYRGLLLVSGMSVEAEQLTWQCCACMGLYRQQQDEANCTVWVQHVNLSATGLETGEGQAGSPPADAASPPGSVAPGDPHTTLVLVAAHGLVAAVLLQPFEPCVDMQLAGRLEGVAAAEWLHQVHSDLGPDLATALHTSTPWATYAPSRLSHFMSHWGAQHAPLPSQGSMGATWGDSPAFNMSNNKTMLQSGSPLSKGGPSGSPLSKGALARMLLQRAGSSASRPRSPHAPAVTAPPPAASTPTARPPAPHASFVAPGTPSEFAPRSPFAVNVPASFLHLTMPTSRSGRGKGGSITQPAAASSTSHSFFSLPTTPRLSGGPSHPISQPTPSLFIKAPTSHEPHYKGSVALVLDLTERRLLVFLDKLPVGCDPVVAAAWPVLAACHHKLRLGAGSAVAVPPKHSRLCMTLEQLERLAALRAPPEAGLRLGHADSAPWHLHPELAPMTAVQQVVLQVPLPAPASASPPPPSSCWYVSGQRDEAGGCEILVLHSADVNEVVVQQQARLLLEQHRVDCL